MAQDYVTVANLALSKLGEDDQIRTPDQQSHAARTVRAVWDAVRQAVLRDHPWNFAMARAELAAQAENVPVIHPWDYRFPLPADFCRLMEVVDPALSQDQYQLESGAILTNTIGPVFIRYVRDVETELQWDYLFVEAFACRLAHQIADRITGSQSRQDRMWRLYERALSTAKGVDAKENPPVPFEDSSWITARFGA